MIERREMGELEGEILVQLWAADRSLTPREVRQALGGSLAYSTVTTVLQRLWRKGTVLRELHGRAYAYRPAVSEAELVAQRMSDQLDRVRDREAALSQFVGALSEQDEVALRDVLRRLGRRR
jgi:predicted transcriptional regulator